MRTGTPKIFGIGLSKTGTSSLARALEILGYRTKDYPGIVRYARGDLASIDLEIVDAHEALTDTPIPSFYRELDARHPGSKFILTVRERAGWLESCKKQFTRKLAEKQNDAHTQLFLDLYGTDVFDEQRFGRGYDQFVEGALAYFAKRPQDLLVIDIAGGEGWERLCAFLGKPVPDAPFPKANVTRVRWIDIAAVAAIAHRAGRRLLAPRGFLRQAVRALRGGDQAAAQRAANRACAVMVKELQRLTPQIPVLSRESGAILDAARAQWNHLWLVDAYVGPGDRPAAPGLHTVSVALIEDGRPIYGVVYAPLTDTTYQGKIGHGAFRIERDRAPERLNGLDSPPAGARPNAPGRGDEGSPPVRGAGQRSNAPHAWTLCACLAGEAQSYRCDAPATEWDTAAADAIARALGRSIVDGNSGEELRYNKKDMVHRAFALD